VADGLILAEGSGPAYVRRARERLGDRDARIVVFAWFSIDPGGRRHRRGHARADRLRRQLEQIAPLLAAIRHR
jgi:hypothetical protein